jgi:rod shape-determining protein MreD
MNAVYLFVVMVVCSLLQAMIPSWAGMGHAKAPILFGAVLYYILTRKGAIVYAAALLAGFLQDALDLVPMGHSMFSYTLIAAILLPYQSRIFGAYWITHMMLGFTAAWLMVWIQYILLAATGTVLPFWAVMAKSFGTALLALLAAPLVFKIVERFDHRLGNIRLREAYP